MSDTPLIAGFIKVRNEVLRSNNIYRALLNMQAFCDEVFVVDDASYDGTYEYIKSVIPEDHIIRVPPESHDFRNELFWKQKLLELIHSQGPFGFVWWVDGDEVLDANGTENIRNFCKEKLKTRETAWAFHYTQLWRNSSWARTDQSFDAGNFIKLWKWNPMLKFNVVVGTHHAQFPSQAGAAVGQAPFEVIHYGNFGVNLRWKCIQYWGGLGGVDRHLLFNDASYRKTPPDIFPSGVETIPSDTPPIPFTEKQVERIRALKDLKQLSQTFCVVLPTYNRGYVLRRTLDSLINQTYENFIVMILDDASTDNTPEIAWEYQEKDPRFFYARYLSHKGGVAMNELGMEIAVNTCEYWTRLGSDDWFLPRKLELDARALQHCDATYGPFVVSRDNTFAEVCSPPIQPSVMRDIYKRGGFEASWANVSVKCDILRKIKEKFGNYVDSRLINMEDRLFNFRVLKFADFCWRGMVGEDFYVCPDPDVGKTIMDRKPEIKPDAVWTSSSQDGSSYNMPVYERDYNLTSNIIKQEMNV
jgi:glycosyltransferase involved in cell wall biosynthesis